MEITNSCLFKILKFILFNIKAIVGHSRNNNNNNGRKFVNNKKSRGGKIQENQFPTQSSSIIGNNMVNQQSKLFYKNGMLNNHNSQVKYFLIGYIEIRYFERSYF